MWARVDFWQGIASQIGAPTRETIAPASCGRSTAATSAAAPPVLERKYPMRKSRGFLLLHGPLPRAYKALSQRTDVESVFASVIVSFCTCSPKKIFRKTEDNNLNHSEGLVLKHCERSRRPLVLPGFD